MNNSAPSGGAFPKTRWTLIEQVREGNERALGELCQIYWYPVYAYLRRSGERASDAEDLVQGFFASLLEKGVLGTAESERGKLRTYLLTALKRFRVSEYRKRTSLKRGGGRTDLRFDAAESERLFAQEPIDDQDPEALFEQRWALSLLDEALLRTEREYASSGKEKVFAILSPYLAGQSSGDPKYAKLAEQLEISAGGVQVAVHRMRKRFRNHFEAAVTETVESPDEVADEIRHVLKLLSC